METMEIPDEMIQDLLPAVREQVSAPETAYVKACLERLTEKLEEQEALELVGGRPFNPEKYRTLLKDLPLLPDESP